MARDIEQITPFTALEDSVVRNAGVEALPNSPSSAGIRASELKRRFYQPLEEVRDDIDDRFTKINSNFTEIDEDLTTVEGLAFDKANVEQEVSTSTIKVPSSNLLKTQLDLKVSKAGAENITGIKTYKSGATPLIEDAPSSNTMAANKAYVDTMIPLTAIKKAISETPSDDNLLSEKFINTTYATKSDIASVFEYKGTVADYTALSAITGQGVGDTYNMTASYLNTPAGTNWAWNGTIWDALGGDIIIETAQSTSAVKVPSSKLLTDSTFARVYRSLAELGLTGLTTSSTPSDVAAAMADNSILEANTTGYTNIIPTGITESTNGVITIHRVNPYRCYMYFSYQSSSASRLFYSTYRLDTGFKGWYENIYSEGTQDISGVKTYSASPLVPTTPSGPSAAVAKSYVDGLVGKYNYDGALDIDWKSTNNTAFNTAWGTGWDTVMGYKSCRANSAADTSGTTSRLGFAGAYHVIIITFIAGWHTVILTDASGNSRFTMGQLNIDSTLRDFTTQFYDMQNTNKAETITGIKTFATGATPLITDTPTTSLMAVNKEHLDGTISTLQMTINGLLLRISALEGSGGKVFFDKSGYAVSITATQDGSAVTTGFTGVGTKVVVMTLTKPANNPIYGCYFSGWTKDGVNIISGSDGFVIATDNVNHVQTLTFTYGTGKDGTYQGNVTKYTLPTQ